MRYSWITTSLSRPSVYRLRRHSRASRDIESRSDQAATWPASAPAILANRIRAAGLQGSQFTDAGLAHLKGLTNLVVLHLWATQVTDAGLEHLTGLTMLKRLNLFETQVTDAGLVHLKGLTNLKGLGLNDTQVTDSGLVHLKGLTNLESLTLGGTQVTDAGVAELKKALPKCNIGHSSQNKRRNQPSQPPRKPNQQGSAATGVPDISAIKKLMTPDQLALGGPVVNSVDMVADPCG